MAFKKILVALDRSALEQSVFHQALDLARSQGAELLVMHCLDTTNVNSTSASQLRAESGVGTYPVAGLGAPNPIDPLHPTYQEEIQGNFDAIDQWLQQHQTTARSHDVPTEIIRQMGNPSHEISRMAKEWQADLVVMGRRGRRGIQEALLGSVSNHVVHHAPCAVMVIQGQEAK